MVIMWLDLKYISAIIGLGLLIMIISGALLNYLNNPIWINFFLGSILVTGIITFFLYIIFLWEFIENKQKVTIIELEKELAELKRK